MPVCRTCGERNPERARFCMRCATPLVIATRVAETRKVVTILFADVTGSTAIGERLDPEAVRRVLTTFYTSARETLERQGGTVEKFIGDAVMAVFGVPRVREDDAVRAVRAAWGLLDVMASMNAELGQRYGAELQLRIGVNTGEVVAGDPATGSSFVAGDAVNVAARLEQVAAPGTVYLGAETLELARAIAEVEPVEPLQLKGKSEPVPAFRLLGIRSRDEPAPSGDAPLVGRTGELESLDRALDGAARTGSARTVAILGPAGIGKTRLVLEFVRRAVGRAQAIGCRCTREGERAAIAPVRDLLTSALGLGADAPTDELEQATRTLVGSGDRADLVVATLRRLVDEGDTTEAAWVLAEVLGTVSERDPTIVAIDDAHLLSPAVRGLLSDARRRLAQVPILWLEVYRTDAEEPIGSPGFAETIHLAPLPLDEARDLLVSAAPGSHRAEIAKILEAAEGNPLFLLETARLLAERPDATVGLPSGIRALLAARFEALADAERRALEVTATIGRTAPLDWIEELLEPGEAAALGDLVAKGFVSRTVETISFSHGSLREVVYGSATKQRRADLHERIAGLAERDEQPVEILAFHLERAAALRAELGAPDERDRRLSGRAAIALARAGVDALGNGDRDRAVDILPRARALIGSAEADDGAPRAVVGDLAFRLGAWDEVVEMLTSAEASPQVWNKLGVATVKRARTGDLEQGRILLERAAEAGDVDGAAALAGTWKGLDEERALELYRSALELDPTDPYALGNVLEYELERAGDLSAVADRRPALASAILRRRGQALAGEDRPWSFFDLGKFELLLGEDEECLASFAAAVASSSAPFMIETTMRSLERIRAACQAMSGYEWALELLELGRRARFDEHGAETEPSVWILVGGSHVESGGRIAAYREALVGAFEGAVGTVISGGTGQGVSALAADVSSAVEGVRAVGYLPATLPEDVEADDRYDELRRTEGAAFAAREPLAYWRDMLDEKTAPADVRVIGIGGGRLTALELRIAIALGATVGVIAGSGGASSALLADPAWGTSGRLVELEPTATALRGFLVVD
jgi:class 3 adenylate cyclase/tetratricopeptide (TPR) repeat protein